MCESGLSHGGYQTALCESGWPGRLVRSLPSPVYCSETLHDIHTMPLNGNWGHWCLGSHQIHNHFPTLCYIELQMALLTPCNIVVHHISAFCLLTLADASNCCRVVGKLLTCCLRAHILWSVSQVGVDSVKQVDNGVLNAHSGLVGKL